MQTRLVSHDHLSPRYAELNPHVIVVPTPVVPMRDLDHHSAAHDSGVVGVELRGPFPDVLFNRFGVARGAAIGTTVARGRARYNGGTHG